MGEPNGKQTFVLVSLSVASFALTYLTSILLARTLGPVGYDDYAVAVSAVAILATVAEMGTGKLAMRVMPAMALGGEWSLTKGYRRFSAVLILAVCMAIIAVISPAEYFSDHEFGNYALGLAILFLPLVAWVATCSEFVMANRAPIRSALVIRIILPVTTLVLVAALIASPYELNAPRGILCYGMGSVVGLVVCLIFLWQTTPKESLAARSEYRLTDWFTGAMPFLLFGLLLVLLGKVGVIILEIVHPDEAVVAVYSVALDTGTFIVFVAKSTDKMFLPEISLLLEQNDRTNIERLRLWRQRWMGAICVLYLTLMVLFGQDILALFGERFVAGYPALLIISLATSIWTMTSISPTYLKFVKKHHFVVAATGLAVFSHIVLCYVLSPRYAATGAAISYAIPVAALYLSLRIAAQRHLHQLGRKR